MGGLGRLVLCAAAVFLPGSEALTYPAVLWPGWCWQLLCLQAGRSGHWQSGPRPCPRNSCWKNKNPRIVPDTEVLFVSRSLDLS